VESEATVLVHPPQQYAAVPLPLAEFDERREVLADEYFDWLAPSQYCPALPAIGDMAKEVEARCDGTVRGVADAAAALIHEQFTYTGATRGALRTQNRPERLRETL
jgi:hypothetical protein